MNLRRKEKPEYVLIERGKFCTRVHEMITEPLGLKYKFMKSLVQENSDCTHEDLDVRFNCKIIEKYVTVDDLEFYLIYVKEVDMHTFITIKAYNESRI